MAIEIFIEMGVITETVTYTSDDVPYPSKHSCPANPTF